MKKEDIQAYCNRIAQANRSELVVITYEIIIEHIEDANVAFLQKDMEGFHMNLERAQAFVKELMVGLDFKQPIAKELMPIYIFINKTLIEAKIKKSNELLPRINKMLSGLLESFREVSKMDQSAPLMQNTHKIYAGLTYGRNDLNETAIGIDMATRGFKA